MKTKVKILFAAMLFVGMTGSVFAQTSQEIATTATVQSELTIGSDYTAGTDDVVFGTVAANSTPTLSANSTTKTDCGSTAHLGKITVAAQSNVSIVPTFSYTTLTSGELTPLVFTPSVYRNHLTAATYGSTAVTSGTAYTTNTVAEGAVAGTDHFFIGGTLAVPEGQAAGSYAGTFTLSVAYN